MLFPARQLHFTPLDSHLLSDTLALVARTLLQKLGTHVARYVFTRVANSAHRRFVGLKF